MALSFEANSDQGIYSGYKDESARLKAYSDAMLNIKNFTSFRGRVFKRNFKTEISYTNEKNISMEFKEHKSVSGSETL